jgi:hypothetical protein
MSRFIVGSFEREEDLLQAVQAVRACGWRIRDVYTPYAVHGLDEMLGMKKSWLSRVCFVCGLGGVILALWFQFWTSTRDWPLNVGGRPWNALPAFVPVTFEAMVLCAGSGLVLAWLIACRLYPGKKVALPILRVSDDRFALIVEESDLSLEDAALRQLLQDSHAVSIEERTDPTETR